MPNTPPSSAKSNNESISAKTPIERLEEKIRVTTCSQKPQVLLCLMMRSNGKTIEHRTCDVDGCDSKFYGKGYCLKHHARWKRHGNTTTVMKGNQYGNYRNIMSRTPIYRTWQNMKSRCSNKNATSYKDYGGRGIKFCEGWKSFEVFYRDMGSSHFKGATIEREDVNGNYQKDNCKWIPRIEQSKNTRSNVYIEHNGKMKIISDWAREYNLPTVTLWKRLFTYGMTIEESMVKGKRKRRFNKNPDKFLSKILL